MTDRSADVDMLYCCDVLTHVRDLDRVIAAMSRVLRPGGVYQYAPINCTLPSNLIVIKVTQE